MKLVGYPLIGKVLWRENSKGKSMKCDANKADIYGK